MGWEEVVQVGLMEGDPLVWVQVVVAVGEHAG